jgi:subtilisin family serine protease
MCLMVVKRTKHHRKNVAIAVAFLVVITGVFQLFSTNFNNAVLGLGETQRVIVEFRTHDKIATLTRENIPLRQQSIAAGRDELTAKISNIKQGQMNLVYKYANLPLAVFEVDSAGLAQLTQNPLVVNITEDKSLPLTAVPTTFGTIGGTLNAVNGYAGYSDGTNYYSGDYLATGDGYEIAVLDTGVDGNHHSLAGKVVSEACFGFNGSNPSASYTSFCPGSTTESYATGSAMDCTLPNGCGHGTMVAGAATMPPVSLNLSGYGLGTPTFAGSAPGAKIIAVQVSVQATPATDTDRLNICGKTSVTTCSSPQVSLILAGLDHIIQLAEQRDKIAAVNISSGGGAYASLSDCRAVGSAYDIFQTAIQDLADLGIPTVIANGNNGDAGKIAFPACVENAIAVGATDIVGTGLASYSQNGILTDLLAPGGSGSGAAEYMWLPQAGSSNYGGVTGTSFAAPTVAGAFAVLRGKWPNATVYELTARLVNNGTPVTDSRTGLVTKPLIKVDQALQDNITPLTTNYTLSGDYITAVPSGATTGNFVAQLSSPFQIVVRGPDNAVRYDSGQSYYMLTKWPSSGFVGTSSSLPVTTGTTVELLTYPIRTSLTTKTYTTVIKGDVTGDGQITLTDLVRVSRHLAGVQILTGAYFKAGDVTGSGAPSLTGLVKISRHLAGLEVIN